MPDVPILVALIAAGAALTPQILTWRQSVAQARIGRQEKASAEVRRAYGDLYDATVDLETEVRKNKGRHGADVTERMAKIWELSATADKAANTIAFFTPDGLADAARKLADSGKEMVQETENEIDPQQGELRMLPDFSSLEASREAFRKQAVAQLRDGGTPVWSAAGRQRSESGVAAGPWRRWLGGRGRRR